MRLVDRRGAGNPAGPGDTKRRHARRPEIGDADARDILRRRVALGGGDRRHAALCQSAGLRGRERRDQPMASTSSYFQIGDLRVARVEESCQPAFPPDIMFPDLPSEALQRQLQWMAPNYYDPQARLLVA